MAFETKMTLATRRSTGVCACAFLKKAALELGGPDGARVHTHVDLDAPGSGAVDVGLVEGEGVVVGVEDTVEVDLRELGATPDDGVEGLGVGGPDGALDRGDVAGFLAVSRGHGAAEVEALDVLKVGDGAEGVRGDGAVGEGEDFEVRGRVGESRQEVRLGRERVLSWHLNSSVSRSTVSENASIFRGVEER